jgi:hypothetical protein
MNAQARIRRVDVNRGLRDRLGRNRAAGESVRPTAEGSTLTVTDLQSLVRSRFATKPANRR